jgi:hypothetical protein
MKKTISILLVALALSSAAFADVKKIWIGVDGLT